MTPEQRIEKLEKALEKAKEALKFYARCGHFRRQRVQGLMIEVDIDAGPLYDYYEQILPNEEGGMTARQALAEIEEVLK